MRAAIALGSNLGDRLAYLTAAWQRLVLVGEPEYRKASIYETEPLDCPVGSQTFYNSVIEFTYRKSASDLLRATKQIEHDLGRRPSSAPNSPREIDLDILYLGDSVIERADLKLPHPRLIHRRFVLQPLVELQPDLVLPNDNQTIESHLASLASTEGPARLIQATW